MPETRSVSLREMVEAMGHLPDDTPLRWFQIAVPGSDGVAVAGDTLLVTLGQARRELGITELTDTVEEVPA